MFCCKSAGGCFCFDGAARRDLGAWGIFDLALGLQLVRGDARPKSSELEPDLNSDLPPCAANKRLLIFRSTATCLHLFVFPTDELNSEGNWDGCDGLIDLIIRSRSL